VHHAAVDDTSKVQAIDFLVEECWDNEVWPKYNKWVYSFIQSKLAAKPSEKVKRSLLISYAESLGNIGYVYATGGDVTSALEYFQKSLKIKEEIGDKYAIANSLNNIGVTYQQQGDVPKALEYSHRSLKIREEIGDKQRIAVCLNNIGSIYNNQGDVKNALKFFNKCLALVEEIDDKFGMANTLNNIGSLYKDEGDIDNALDCHQRSMKLREEIGDKKGVGNSLNNIGHIYDTEANYKEALNYYQQSLKIQEEIGDKKGISISLYNIGRGMLQKGDVVGALPYGKRSIKIAQEIGIPDDIMSAAELLSDIYAKQNKGMQALEMHKLFVEMRDSINNEETQRATAQTQARYEYEKQKSLDDIAHAKRAAAEKTAHEISLAVEKEGKKKQIIIIYAIAGGLILVIVFLIFVFNRLAVTKKQKQVIELAHLELGEKNKEIMDSITYAKRIQSAILPPAKLVKEYLQDSFILYKPKDVVAGDFYWMEHRDGKVLFAAADCTGHGVPGAMVSVICNNALNRSVREHGLTKPGEILDKSREIVIQEFDKSDEDVRDGMDIALCSLDGNKVEYAGANNPLWLIRKGELIELKGDKQPIGKYAKEEPFNTYELDLEAGDTLYIFSDGYADQFGGTKGKKLKTANFKRLLVSIQDKPMKEQKEFIDTSFEEWRGDLEQIDDVCVIGVRI